MPLHRLAPLLLFLAGLCTTSLVLGNDASEHWRSEADRVRLLAENDLAHAQQEALRLQATLPVEATAADRARMLELIEHYKSESQRREIEELTRRGKQAAIQQRWLWTVLGGSLAMLIGTIIFLFRLQRAHHTLEAASQQLQQAQNDQQAILDAIPDVLVEVGLDGRYHSIYHLHRRVDMLAAPVVGKTVCESLPPEAAQICMAALREAHENGIATGVQYQLPSVHGERWFELSAARKSVAPGQTPRFVAISRDITARKEAEEQLQRTQNKQQAILEAIPDLIFEIGLDGHYYDCLRPQLRSELLLAPARDLDLIGHNVADVMPPEAAQSCLAALHDAHETGISTGRQIKLPSPQGERWFELSIARKTVEPGQEPRFIVLSRNVTERVRMAAQLAEREQRYREIFDNSQEGLFLFDVTKDDRFLMLEVNPAFEQLVGISRADMVGRYNDEILPPKEAEKVAAKYKRCIASGAVYQEELELNLPVGQRTYHSTLVPVRDGTGRVSRIVGLTRDITERKCMEVALEQERATLRSFFRALPEMAWMKDTQGRYIACNPIFERFFGAPEADIVGKTDFDFVDAELATSFRQKDTEALAAGQPRVTEEWVTFAKDCQLALLETIKMAVHDAQGQVIGVLGIGRDITARKEAERMLHESEQAIRAMVENAPDLIARYDTQYRRIYANPATLRLYGLPLNQLLGKTPDEISAFPRDFMDALKRVMQDGQEQHIELPFRQADGTRGWGDARLVPEFDPAGKIVSVLSIGRDISERKSAEDALRESEQKYRTLIEQIQAAVIVHDTDTRILTSNRVARDILGLSEEQLQGKAAIDPAWHILREDGTPAQPADYPVNRVLASRQPLRNHLMGVHHPDTGCDLWALVNADPVFADDGEIAQVIVTFIDITQRRRDERKLVLLNRALNASSDAAFILNEQGRFVYVNDAACRSLGYSREELLAMGPQDIDAGLSPETLDRMRKALFEKGPPQGQIESKHRARDGRTFPVEISASAIELEGAKFGLSMVRDITERKATEEALRTREQQFRTLAENAPDAIIRHDPQGRMLYVNPQLETNMGVTAETLLGKTPLEAYPDGRYADYQAEIAAVAATGQPGEIELELPDGGGGVRYQYVRFVAERGLKGEIMGVLALGRDITPLKQAEAEIRALNTHLEERVLQRTQELAESEKRYRHSANLLQSILEGSASVSVYALDRDYRLLAFNKKFQAAAKRLWKADITIGMSILEAIDNDAHREFFRKGAALVLAGRSYFLDSKEERTENGLRVYEYHDNYGAPIRNDNGEIVGLTVFAIDVTERKQSEQKLKDALEFTEGVINAIPDLLFEMDREGRYKNVWTHTPELLAAQKEELLGNTVNDVLSPESAKIFMEALHEADEKGASFGKVIRIDLPLKPSWFELSVSRKAGHTSPEDSFLVLSRDVTGMKQYEVAREAALAEAERLVRARSEFLAQMSHELRTPLNGILGYAQILLRDKSMGERQHAGLHVIQQSGEHLLTLINDILDFAKIDAGKVELDPADFSLPRFLHMITEMVRVKAEVKRLTFVCDFAPDLPRGIHADEKRLRQILLNLLSNAVKYTDHGQVVFHVRYLPPSRLHLEVRDSGIGIDANRLESIFQPFEQVSDAAHQIGGTGLGLPISRQLVRMMGSDIQVTSRLGEGSIFWFELEAPVLYDVTDRPTGESVTGYTGPRKKILVVDDVTENRALLVDMLGQLGFEMSEAANGIECLEQAQSLRPDLILMDVVMPEMDGLETTRRLRKLPGFDTIPIIALSASVTRHDQKSCLEAGMNAFMPKPIDTNSLLERIASFLRLDWLSPLPPAQAGPAPDTLPAPPDAELKALHELALQGDIRNILQLLDHLDEFGERYRPFASELRRLARGYQSKAILRLVEQSLERRREP